MISFREIINKNLEKLLIIINNIVKIVNIFFIYAEQTAMLSASHKILYAMVTKIVRMAKTKRNVQKSKNRQITGQMKNPKLVV